MLVEPIPLRRLLDEAVRQSRRHFRAIFLPVAVPVGIAYGFLPIAQLSWLRSLSGATEAGSEGLAAFGLVGGLLAFLGTTGLAMIVQGLGYGALLVAAVDAVGGRAVSMRRAWGTVLSPRVFGTLCLAALAMGAGLMVCILPGLYVGLLFCLTLAVVADEGVRGLAALGRSRQLMTYNPTRDFGASPILKAFLIFFAGWLVGTAVGLAIQIPLGVFQQVYMLRAAAEGRTADPTSVMADLMWIQVPATVLGMMVNTGVNVFVFFAVALFYVDLRGRREGQDLERAVQTMVEARPRPISAEA